MCRILHQAGEINPKESGLGYKIPLLELARNMHYMTQRCGSSERLKITAQWP